MRNGVNKLFNIKEPLLLAPMAGAADIEMAIGVAKAGGLGSLACAMLSLEQIKKEVKKFKEICPDLPLNLNFFCHENLALQEETEQKWMNELKEYYKELNVNLNQEINFLERKPFNEETCKLLEELKPEVVSFHFGLPDISFIKRLKKIGCKIISSATTVDEALWLEEKGCDAIIAQGLEAGGHRGMFLSNDLSTQIGTLALVPLIVDQVKVPVIAAGGIADGRGIIAAFALGARAVQIGSAYLLTNEAKISSIHKEALLGKDNQKTVLTNLFSGKPARSLLNRLIKEKGSMSNSAPPFPFAGKALVPLKNIAEKNGLNDFSSLWSGQAIALRKDKVSSEELTKKLIVESKQISVSF